LISLFNSWSKSNKTVLSNATSLIGTTAITSAFGFAYWWLAARQFSPEAVGGASATISAMLLLGTVGVLGFGTLLMGELPRQSGREKSLIATALITVGFAGTVLGVLFAIVVPWLSPDLSTLSANFTSISLFSFGVCLTAMTLVVDQALIGLFRGELQLWRNVIMAVVKLGALLVVGFWFSNRSGLIIYATWAIGNLLSLVTLAGFAWSKSWNISAYFPQWGLLRNLGRSALGHHALNLCLQIPGLVLPILVTSLLSVRINAYFYTAWMIANLASAGPNALTMVLYAVVAADQATLIQKTRLTLKLSLLVGLGASGVLMVGAGPVLNFFGASYAKEATWSLLFLGLGVFPLIIRTHYVAINRIYSRIERAAKIMALCAVFELTLATIGAKVGGLTGLSLGWLIATCIEAVLMAGTVFRVAVLGKIESS
jgi:O-antigen/teichoic acid export membrane protein